ncbi:SIR2 family protein [Pseudoxanthomonas suwonensis]|uniref:SIR2 family protein n=1 Tax=Pseudoxanthomonas suwonensis TaxID=314722 RepID=UPI000AF2A3DC|nr:SIR2 family protein [Pseudoxanthomonas suwonensis]
MPLGTDLVTRLLEAIEANSLVFLCGAGLSVPAPSSIPAAARVAEICYDTYQHIAALPPALRADIDQLAEHFHQRGDFKPIFINQLVPWDDLVGRPNAGHAAIADLLICRAAHAALTANFDTLIEHWAEEHKVAMRGALDGQEAVAFSNAISPLVKFHGCLQRDREQTLWTKPQLLEPEVQARVASCSQWMNLHLPQKDLVVVGFWTDWGYLNEVFANAFAIANARSVTVFDIGTTAELQQKAPDLWTKLNGLSNRFEHVQISGAEALEQLRVAHSKVWARRFFALGQPMLQAVGQGVPATANPDLLDCDALYDLRRDGEGVPYTRAAKTKAPPQAGALSAFARLRFLHAGATQQASWLDYGGQTIRIVNGAGRDLASVEASYKEPSTRSQADMVVCAGAIDLAVPASLIASGSGASIVRPAPGGGARWLTWEQAQLELGI